MRAASADPLARARAKQPRICAPLVSSGVERATQQGQWYSLRRCYRLDAVGAHVAENSRPLQAIIA
eukprot:13438162-Alexandrium_andersonii.AAC.1